jgi:hypothetical protein
MVLLELVFDSELGTLNDLSGSCCHLGLTYRALLERYSSDFSRAMACEDEPDEMRKSYSRIGLVELCLTCAYGSSLITVNVVAAKTIIIGITKERPSPLIMQLYLQNLEMFI